MVFGIGENGNEDLRKYIFVYGDFEKLEATILIGPNDTEEEVRKCLEAGFPSLRNSYIKGVYEGSPNGVFKPLGRVYWGLVEEGTKFFIDVDVGERANTQKLKKETQKKKKKKNNDLKIKLLRQRWGEGYRKCSRCQKMYLISQNKEDACEFVDEGFSPSEGRYKHIRYDYHQQAKAKYEEYNDHIKDIKVIGKYIGTADIGLVQHAKEGGTIGCHGENINGWTPDDFVELPGFVQNDNDNNNSNNNNNNNNNEEEENQGWCSVM
eukprot:TRINITY_DN59276_c1_g1_i1.p1 TRINITY_DN59276_c1_g1~~TRINITY_DN59276_c1_g1_i1.p1  ORF type:complete len:265 (-),score=66.85 TRINITY_DN59276_c1_g1_i1:137-931(-)